MIEIKRNAFSIIAYNESEGRGIYLPVSESTDIDEFVKEVKRIANDMKFGIILSPLTYYPEDPRSYHPMQKYFETEKKQGAQIFKNDAEVKKLYKFFFSHSIIQISPSGPSYFFCL